MKYCPYCGAGLDEDMRFCPSCGKPFESGKENPHISKKSAAEEKTASVSLPATETDPKMKHRGGIIALIAAVIIIATVGRSFTSDAFKPKEEPVPTEEPVIPFTDNTDAIAQASESVVMLTCYDKDGEPYATGSGFAVFDDGVIVTNYHVIEDGVYSVTAQTEGGFSFECPTVLACDADKDIAILKTDRETGLSLLTPGNSRDLQKGEKVVAIGSPLGLINSVSTGVFSGYITDKAGSVLQFTAAISHGSSGGALFNDAGEVIGITFASLTEGQSLNLAVPIDDVKALYDNAGSQQAMSMEAFYDSIEHTPPMTIMSISELLYDRSAFDGQEVYVEGYVSTRIDFPNVRSNSVFYPPEIEAVMEKSIILLVGKNEKLRKEIFNASDPMIVYFINSTDYSRYLDGYDYLSVDIPYQSVEPGEHIVVHGIVSCEYSSNSDKIWVSIKDAELSIFDEGK
ncbi:MAG: trypsin-like peptidase domain-containing protein [Oscillospiraceae bacterium]|nr:trypsin-like peptidase domain-containing protein [Oscillospiraceae bacterium]